MSNAFPPGLAGYIASQQHQGQQQSQQMGMLSQLTQLQGQMSQQGRLLRTDERDEAMRAAVAQLGPGASLADVAKAIAPIDPMKAAGLMEKVRAEELRVAQVGKLNREEAQAGQQQAARGSLAQLVASGGFEGNAENPVVSPPTGVMMNEGAARTAAMEGMARGERVGINVPNPGNVRGFSLLSGLPQGSLTEILKETAPLGPEKPYTLGPGAIRMGPNNQPVATAPFAPRQEVDTPRAVVGVDAQGNQTIDWARPSQGRQTFESKPPSLAGSGAFTPETLEFTARQYLKGDRQAAQGFARNSTARIALQNAIVDEAKKQNMSPEQTAAQMADFAGTVAGSRTVGQRAANISLAATEAQEMLGIVKETSDKFSRTNFVPWNIALKHWESGTGSPEIAEFGAAVNALVNVYARAINPTGVPTVSDKEHARAVLNTVQSPQQVNAVLGIINRELEIAKKAPATVREATRAGIAGIPTDSVINPQRRASDGQPKSYPVPSAGAIGRLKMKPAERAQFEEVFGPGSADQHLRK